MERIIDSGFTVYVRKDENGFTAGGLKKLNEGMGMCPKEIKIEKLNMLEQLPTVTKSLENGNMLQMYRSGFCYFCQLGEAIREGHPDDAADCFKIFCESAASTFPDALVTLEEKMSKLEANHERPIKKTYRLYGSDKYASI